MNMVYGDQLPPREIRPEPNCGPVERANRSASVYESSQSQQNSSTLPLMSKSPMPFGFPLPGAGGALGLNGVPAVPTRCVISAFSEYQATSAAGMVRSLLPVASICPLARSPRCMPDFVLRAAYSHSLSEGSLNPFTFQLHSAKSHFAVSEESRKIVPLYV